MAYIAQDVEFIETPTLTRLLADLLTDDEYAGLQNVLVENPERGGIIKGGGGIRKLRHALPGRGKSGGVRVIYSWLRDDGQIYMLLIYPKSRKDDLTDRENRLAARICEGAMRWNRHCLMTRHFGVEAMSGTQSAFGVLYRVAFD